MDRAETSLSQLGALVSEFHALLNKILTTPEHLAQHPESMYITYGETTNRLMSSARSRSETMAR